MSIIVKIHETYRAVISVCDSELIGKKFEEGNRQLDVAEDFYGGGDEMSEEEAIALIQDKLNEDACFNFAGEKAVDVGIKAGAINKNCVMKIQGIPYAMLLV